ncbi:DUF3883 domain-containing protein, partial [Paenibacillus farraposensis]
MNTSEFTSVFQRFQATTSTQVLELSKNCSWININSMGNIEVSEHGNEILMQANMQDALRIQLKHLIRKYRPSWSYLLHKGRKEAFQYFPPNVKQCFKEAELINSYEPAVIEWWDQLAFIARKNQEDNKLRIGRAGEELSLQYEKNRTGKNAVWQSIESNLSGFDILSCVSSSDASPLCIEVKATTYTDLFPFYLTRNEWSVAETSQQFYFHLWILGECPELYIVDKNNIESHIPFNKGNGTWESVKITFDIETLKEI